MSEADCRRWIAETIEWLRSRKARPDQERICKMVQRRHGVSPSRTRRQLDRLLRSRAVLRVRYKGSHSYRNAVPGQLEPAERSGRTAGGSGRDRSSGQRGPARDKSRPPAEQLSVVVTRARHKEVLEQQVARARGRKPPAEMEGEAAERRRRHPVTDSGPERKKTRRTKEADPSDSEGSDEDEDNAAPVKGCELVGQEPSGAQKEAEAATDCGSEDSDTEGSPVKSPDTEGHSAEDVGEKMPTEERLEASLAVGQGTSPDPVDESEAMTEAEPRSEAEVRLCPGSTGEAGSSDGPVAMEKGCGEEPGVHQGEEDAELKTLDQLGPVVCDTAGLPQCTEDRPRAAYDQRTSYQLESQTSEVPEVGGASCLLTPSASPVEMVPEENGPSDRHLLEEEGKSVDPTEWSITDVVNYFKEAGFPEQAVAFEDQEIDGKSLLLMKRNDVLTGLAIKLGPALKIYEYHIKVLQLHHFNNETPSC
ncbi:sterile alpha motif domain-containing protein 1-like [Mobula hypostoma]|uniref:sterile alpha motif domain-containing protein 1-like n=1 Tax=Mobula hypostoma TaxID=723540 RepID=UPI002FC2DE57